MRIRTLALSGLPGLCALTLACSDGDDTPTAPDTPAAVETNETAALRPRRLPSRRRLPVEAVPAVRFLGGQLGGDDGR